MNIDDKTNIPLYAVIISSPFIVGTVLWLANIDSKATAASIEAKTTREILLDIRDRIVRLEEHVSNQGHRGPTGP